MDTNNLMALVAMKYCSSKPKSPRQETCWEPTGFEITEEFDGPH